MFASRSRSSALSMDPCPTSSVPSIPSIGVLCCFGSSSSSRLPTKAAEHRPSKRESSAIPFNRSAKLESSVCSMHFGTPFSSSSCDHSYSCSSMVRLFEKNARSPLHLRSLSARWSHLLLWCVSAITTVRLSKSSVCMKLSIFPFHRNLLEYERK